MRHGVCLHPCVNHASEVPVCPLVFKYTPVFTTLTRQRLSLTIRDRAKRFACSTDQFVETVNHEEGHFSYLLLHVLYRLSRRICLSPVLVIYSRRRMDLRVSCFQQTTHWSCRCEGFSVQL